MDKLNIVWWSNHLGSCAVSAGWLDDLWLCSHQQFFLPDDKIGPTMANICVWLGFFNLCSTAGSSINPFAPSNDGQRPSKCRLKIREPRWIASGVSGVSHTLEALRSFSKSAYIRTCSYPGFVVFFLLLLQRECLLKFNFDQHRHWTNLSRDAKIQLEHPMRRNWGLVVMLEDAIINHHQTWFGDLI